MYPQWIKMDQGLPTAGGLYLVLQGESNLLPVLVLEHDGQLLFSPMTPVDDEQARPIEHYAWMKDRKWSRHLMPIVG